MKTKKYNLNLVGLKCPLPVLKLAKTIKKIEVNSMVETFSDDPNFEDDILEFCKNSKIEILRKKKQNKTISFLLKKS